MVYALCQEFKLNKFNEDECLNGYVVLIVSDFMYRLNGSSSVSETYGNPCLANSEDFEVKEVEVHLPFSHTLFVHAWLHSLSRAR